MQINKISSTSFGRGMLTVPRENKYDYWITEPADITRIKQNGKNVIITYKVADKKEYTMILPKNVPIEKVLAAYTAAMVAPEGTSIEIGREPLPFEIPDHPVKVFEE